MHLLDKRSILSSRSTIADDAKEISRATQGAVI